MSPAIGSKWLAICMAAGLMLVAFEHALAQEHSPEQLAFFENQIRPTLAQHCYECHGPNQQKGELRLDSLSAILQGGESGPAIQLGDSKNSLLGKAIRYESLHMPPTGKLPVQKIHALLQWIDDKAPAPKDFANSDATDVANKHRKTNEILPQDREHWSFRPLSRVSPPELSEPRKHPIDQWLDRRLSQEGIKPLGIAQTPQLIRRVYYTLTGLPPSFDEINSWTQRLGHASDSSFNEQAYLQLIDELLSRPSYGEHWARHWLDIVRFAQSNGYERDDYKPHAWRYRDYVIESFTKDKPYDRFILEQLAGDELPDANSESRIATGFYRLGVWDDEPDDKRQAEFDDLDDSIVSMGSAFLGLSIGCARCHEHKFDPIPQEDYYRILACIRNIRRHANPENHIDNASSFPLASDEQLRQNYSEYLQHKSAANPSLHITDWALVVRESPNPPPATHVLIRGSASTPGAAVEPGFLSVLSDSMASVDPSIAFKSSESPLNDLFPTSGRRLALARWIAHPGHPLTARVMVNRLWHYHFGRGIVATTADFGFAGSPPSHPELLDHLAAMFIENDWSIKQMHRYILTSEAFKRSSGFNSQNPDHVQANLKDPGNRFLWRQNLRRLQAESIRDSMLAASGELNMQSYGQEMFPKLSAEVLAGQSKPGLGWGSSPAKDQLRRSLYAIVKRSVRDPLLESFDYSNTTSPLTERPQTTVAPQALMLLNSRFTSERAAAMAQRALSVGSNPEDQIRLVYQWTLQRDPTALELQRAMLGIERMAQDYLPLAEQIHFKPDVPVSLFSGYRQQLSAPEFLLGPKPEQSLNPSGKSPWNYYPGVWGGGYEGIDVVEKQFGPHAILQQQDFRDGELRCKLRISRTTEIATLILHAQTDGNRFRGIALRLDPSQETIAIENLQGSGSPHARVHHKMPLDRWFDLRFKVESNFAQVWIESIEDPKPLIELQFAKTDSDDEANTKGSFGVACWGGMLSLDQANLHVHDPDHPATKYPIRLAYAQGGIDTQSSLEGWSRYAGQWILQSDGSLRVGAEQGPKLIWDQQPLSQGSVSVEMKVSSQQANIGGLILCVSEPKTGADNWLGYEVSLNIPKKTILFGEHRNNWRPLAETPVDIQPDRWHTLRAEIASNADHQTEIRVYLDQANAPAIVQTLIDPLPGNLLGLRTWGSEILFRNLRVCSDSQEINTVWTKPRQLPLGPEQEAQVAESQKGWASRKAFEMFCRTLMNLNEFIYID